MNCSPSSPALGAAKLPVHLRCSPNFIRMMKFGVIPDNETEGVEECSDVPELVGRVLAWWGIPSG